MSGETRGRMRFFNECAYQWAESRFKQQKRQKIVHLNFDYMLELLEKGDLNDQEIYFFESFYQKPPLMMLEEINLKRKKARRYVYMITKETYEEFKSKHNDFLQICLLLGRIAYRKDLAERQADLPRFNVSDSGF